MFKLILYVKPRLEEYDVKVYVYDSSGKLVEERGFPRVKQVVIRSPEVRLSRQLFHEYIAMVLDAFQPRLELKEGGLLYVYG